MNTVCIVGNLTRDPETRQAGEYMVTTLGVAVNERVKQDGQYVERANFFDVEVWGKMGENCATYLGKGRQVALSGPLRWELWEAQDGQKRSKVKIVANDVQFLGTKDGAKPDTKPDALDRAKEFIKTGQTFTGDGDSDIPF